MANMFDKHDPFTVPIKEPFTFIPTRYEIWKNQKMIASGKTTLPIKANVITEGFNEKMEIVFSDTNLHGELSRSNIFDIYRTSGDRLQLLTIPEETNSPCQGFLVVQTFVGSTRRRKIFNSNEPYCCSIFTVSGRIAKITFSFSNPEKLIEFYYEPTNF